MTARVEALLTHPEDALDRVRRSEHTATDLEELMAHAAACPVCAEELRVIAEPEAPTWDDPALLERITTAALDENDRAWAQIGRKVGGALGLDAADLIPRERDRSRTLRPPAAKWWLTAAGVLLSLTVSGGIATAAVWVAKRILADEPAPAVEPAAPPPSHEPPRRRVASRAETPEPTPPVIADDLAEPADERDTRGTAPTATELLERANLARRDGRYAAAARLYRAVQQRYPHSREQAVSRVSLGRLYLDQMRRTRDALREFDRYLAQREHATLREEALVGRALALTRLGRVAGARAAWTQVIERYPTSLSADRARRALVELE
jgi:TolA-binding protein